jgi:redox-sensitive bicupin YhaK (pirin superfamily)
MLHLRQGSERGRFDHGWLKTAHTFSFADYLDPAQMGFRALRVINEDVVAPGQGFGMHPHRDMEIVTYVLEGALAHKDSMGHGEVLRAGELQHMTAGTGVYHSEFNSSPTEPVHLYQIWLLPDRRGLAPGYQQQAFDPARRRGRWQVVASPDARGGGLPIHQDAQILLADLGAGEPLTHAIAPGRHAWLQVLRGAVTVNGLRMKAGDGLAASDESALQVQADSGGEVMVFDLA